ncbi:MAG: hypothetical protein QJT81_02785 [Candidatus Thiothrix putei]|uniref:Prenyltransferase n=1 Tax=Candidatus Thiothrix putei TaxID=3080811 RepID=A0AA95HHM4_9GAMM|nr:MAG: hypothetical protein QJT81_02785 [Candidatus Thiothrix putei]
MRKSAPGGYGRAYNPVFCSAIGDTMAQEPDLSLRQQPLLRYWLATRPAFLAASVVPAVVGAAAAWAQGYALHGWLLAWTVLAVMLVHAGMNVLNDYYTSPCHKIVFLIKEIWLDDW